MLKIESEKDLERFLDKAVRQLGGTTLKIFNPWVVGYPDRLVLMPGGRTMFVELKSTGEQPRKIQQVRHEQLRGLGFEVRVIDKRKQIEQLIHDLQTTHIPTESD